MNNDFDIREPNSTVAFQEDPCLYFITSWENFKL